MHTGMIWILVVCSGEKNLQVLGLQVKVVLLERGIRIPSQACDCVAEFEKMGHEFLF